MNERVLQKSRRLGRCVSIGLNSLLLLSLGTGCANPIRDAVAEACEEMIEQLSQRSPDDLAQGRVIVAGIHRLHDGQGGDEHDGPVEQDPLAAPIEHEIINAIQGAIKVVDPHTVENRFSTLYPEGIHADELESAIETVAGDLNADLLVTGDFSGNKNDIDVSLRIKRIATNDVIAAADADSSSFRWYLFVPALPFTPLVALWDICVETGDTCFPEHDNDVVDLFLGWLMVPFYFPVAIFRSDYDVTQAWLGFGGDDEHDEESGQEHGD